MMRKMVLAVLLFATILSLTACSGKSTSDTGAESKAEAQTATKQDAETKEESAGNESPYFTFLGDGTTISGLTEEGEKQTSLEIPEQTESLMGLVIADSAAEKVTFASDRDIDLESAFAEAPQLKEVQLPKHLSRITSMAFSGCTGLKSITVPADVTKIEEYAFDGCSSLKEIKFDGDSCETIEEYAFDMCGFEEIALPEGLRTIEDKAFFDCEELVKITFPGTLESIGSFAFNGGAVEEIHFAEETEDIKIASGAFGSGASKITVYITEGSWMDENRDAWNIGFANIVYE